MQPKVAKAFAAMGALESGGIANPDERRMVGHYWLRDPQPVPNDQLRARREKILAVDASLCEGRVCAWLAMDKNDGNSRASPEGGVCR